MDAYAVNAPVSVTGSVKDLAAYLAIPARNDFEKARVIYRWIDQNITYDAKAFFSKQLGDQSAVAALRTRMAVCGGYSNLFEALGKAAGLEVVTIDGWAKGFGYDLKNLDGEPDHAWNAIKVDGAWYLIDSTWGAGHLTETNEFVRSFTPYFWLTPPAQFINDHLPSDSRWQLLATPVSKKEYADMPMLSPGYFDYGLQLPSGTVAVTKVTSQTALLIDTPQDVLLTARVERDGNRLDSMWATAKRNGAKYEVKAVFPGPGRYDLVIFAKRTIEAGSYSGVVTLSYDVSQGQPDFAGFPLIFDKYYEYGLLLPSGVGAVNRVTSQSTLLVGVPADVMLSAAVEQNGQRLDDMWTFVQRNGAQYEVTATFPSIGKFDLVIFAKKSSDLGNYTSVAILGYDVGQGQPTFAGFPKTYLGFAESGAFLYSPKQGGFAIGSSQTFKITVPKALDVQVVIGTAWKKLAKQADTIEGAVTITGTPVKICAAFDSSNNYSCLLEYR